MYKTPMTFQQLIEGLYLALQKGKSDLRPYDAQPASYNASGQIGLLRPCNGWTVVNKGTNNVTVNGIHVLAPNEFIAVAGNEGEEFTGYLRLGFAINGDPGNNAIVWQKFYVSGHGKYDKATM
jgi:hypothetical protein